MLTIGTVCVKIAGRDAGKQCVIVEEAKNGFVLIEGAARRRMCNVKHLEPLGRIVDVKNGASHDDVMKSLGFEVKKLVIKKPSEKPKKTVKKKA